MGLPEKRVIASVESDLFPGMKEWIVEFSGQEIPFEADYESLGSFSDQEHLNSSNDFCDRVFRDFFIGLADVCSDEAGKAAFFEKVENIYFKCKDTNPTVSIDDKTMNVGMTYLDESSRPSRSEYVAMIEELL